MHDDRPTEKELDRYRRMSCGERLQLALDLTRADFERISKLPSDERKAFFDAIRRENDEFINALRTNWPTVPDPA